METKLVGDRTKPLVLEESSNIAFCELSLMEEHNPIRFGMVMTGLDSVDGSGIGSAHQ